MEIAEYHRLCGGTRLNRCGLRQRADFELHQYKGDYEPSSMHGSNPVRTVTGVPLWNTRSVLGDLVKTLDVLLGTIRERNSVDRKRQAIAKTCRA